MAVLRAVVLLNALVLGLYRLDRAEHPAGVVACLAAMTLWSVVATVLYAQGPRRGPGLLGADLLVGIALLVLTPLVKGPEFTSTVPGFWVMAPLLAWAVRYRWRGGLLAGAALALLDLLLRESWSESTYGNAFLLVVGGPVVGYLSGSLQRLADERDRAERAAAASAERARLARAVHDGVLQVLALVQRRGHELGDDGAELARLAGEQETTLRSLIRSQELVGPATGGAGPAREVVVDLAERLSRLGVRPGVQVATPAGAVGLPEATATELVAVTAACLDNVTRHVGPTASAWVLLEDLGSHVTLSVRDEGPGIAEGRLDEAAAQGRLGVSGSIQGRVADLGGEATLETGSFGTEWTVTVPRPVSRSSGGGGAR